MQGTTPIFVSVVDHLGDLRLVQGCAEVYEQYAEGIWKVARDRCMDGCVA